MTHFFKFIHLLGAIGVLGLLVSAYYFTCKTVPYAELRAQSQLALTRMERLWFLLVLIQLITGSLLVFPTHFNFATPWISAAYALLFLCAAIMFWHKRRYRKTPTLSWHTHAAYGVSLVLLILIAHDAVTKTTWIMR
jgi:hypothetical protein